MQYQNTLLGKPIAKHTMYGRERYRKYTDAVRVLRGRGGRKVFPIRQDDRKIDEKKPEKIVPVLTPDRPEKRQNGRRFKKDGDEMFTLTAQDRHGVLMYNFQQRSEDRPSVRKAKEQGLPAPGGSGVLSKEDEAFCIDTGCNQGPMIGSRIRRLTPVEVYRLQGFCPRLPDGSFDDTFYEKAKEVASDTQIYKTAGNAVTVNVIDAIIKRFKGLRAYIK